MAWYSGKVTQSCSKGYYCDGSVEGGLEGGVDIAVLPGTAITSVSAGKVVGAGFHIPGNFVVTVRGHVSFFNQEMDLYYQHMRDKSVNVGDTVSIGQVLGHAGALPVIEFGINPGAWPGGQNNGKGWGGAWGTLPHPGRAINPDKSGFLAALRRGSSRDLLMANSKIIMGNSIMTGTLSFDQTAQLAFNSGFRGSNLVTIVAIAAAESGLRSDAQNLSDPFGGSFGILQLNGSHFHTGNTSKSCALDPQCAFDYAWGLSGHGTNFVPWGAYTNGSYTKFLSQAKTAASHITGETQVQGNTWCDICSMVPPIPGLGALACLICAGVATPEQQKQAAQLAAQKNLKAVDVAQGKVTCESIFGAGSPVCVYLNDPIRLVKIAVGLSLIGLAIFLLVTPETYPIANQIGRTASKVGRGVKSYAKAGTSLGKGLS
jgi:hypothetical protein